MSRLVLALAVVGFAAVGCAKGPLAPTAAAPAYVPLHHNVPATLEDGSLVYLCATQPRAYTAPSGAVSVAEDHYVQSTACPIVPIL